MAREEPAFKIKNSTVPVFVLHLTTQDMPRLKRELERHLEQMPAFFAHTPVVLGLGAVADQGEVPDFSELAGFLVQHGLRLAGVQGGSEAQRLAAAMAGLGLFPETPARKASRTRVSDEPVATAKTVAQPETAAEAGAGPLQPELPGLTRQAEPAPATEPVSPAPLAAPPPPAHRPTVVIDKPVRAGQRIHAEGANLVVLAIVNAGAELIADGDIHVYAPLRGRALAGARGNEGARIFVQSLEAELVSVAGLFQVFEDGIPADLSGQPVQVWLRDGQLVLQALRR